MQTLKVKAVFESELNDVYKIMDNLGRIYEFTPNNLKQAINNGTIRTTEDTIVHKYILTDNLGRKSDFTPTGLRQAVLNGNIKTSGPVYKYLVEDSLGRAFEITTKDLKRAIKLGQIKLVNYSLTANNRLIPTRTALNNEAYSIYYAERVAKHLGYDSQYCTISQAGGAVKAKYFEPRVPVGLKLATAEQLGIVNIRGLAEACKSVSNEELENLFNMLFMDCLTLNTDRFFSNILFIVEKSTNNVVDFLPLRDYNLGFVPDFIEGFDTFIREDYIYGLGITFEQVFNVISRKKSFTSDLQKLKQLKLKKPSNIDIPQSRLDFLNNFLQMQVDYWLSFGKD